jgi:hypothetical protein
MVNNPQQQLISRASHVMSKIEEHQDTPPTDKPMTQTCAAGTDRQAFAIVNKFSV